jgi:hypothetical protein
MAIVLDGTTGITLPANGISLPDNAYTNVATIQSTTSTPPVIKNSSGTEVGTFCRAWVNFNGQGTVAIRAAFNVSTITDLGTGKYSLNFTTPMPSVNYALTASSHAMATLNNRNITVSGSFSTTSTGEFANVENNALTDTDLMLVSVFA